MLVFVQSFVLAFSALLPLINPLASALMFMGVVGNVPIAEFRQLARKVTVSTVLFLLVIELAGAMLLAFFGISLPVVQFAGGLVVAAIGWQLLNGDDKDVKPATSSPDTSIGPVEDKIFYPLTFPITAGPGCVVVMVTLSAHASRHAVAQNIIAHFGIALAIVVLGLTVLVSYTYAPRITSRIAPQTVQGILRVVAFVLLCIGVQIGWNGLEGMIKAVPK